MTSAQIIDMSKLPPPQVVQVLDFEAEFEAITADLIEAMPVSMRVEIAAVLELESEPLTIWAQRQAYEVINLKAAANESALAVMLPYAKGTDLDNIGANFDTPRLVITPENLDASPPILEVLEDDESFRERIHLAPRGFTTAGPEGAYIYHARSADGQVLDAWPHSPTPATVIVSVLSRTGNGQADEDLLAKVRAALSAEDIRPMTDEVIVQSATIIEYPLDAVLDILPGPDGDTVRAAAEGAVRKYAATMHRVKRTATLTGFIGALQVAGVHKVHLNSPTEDVVCGDTEASYCTGFNVVLGAVSE